MKLKIVAHAISVEHQNKVNHATSKTNTAHDIRVVRVLLTMLSVFHL